MLNDCQPSNAPIDKKTGIPMIGDTPAMLHVLELKLGRKIRPNHIPCPLCGELQCVNPTHIQEADLDTFPELFGVLERQGTRYAAKRGDNNPQNKLDQETVLLIKDLLASGMPQRTIAKTVSKAKGIKITQQTVSSINTGRTYAWLDREEPEEEHHRKTLLAMRRLARLCPTQQRHETEQQQQKFRAS